MTPRRLGGEVRSRLIDLLLLIVLGGPTGVSGRGTPKKTSMINEEIAQIFEKMSHVPAFKGADRFCVLAYDRAATSLRDFESDKVVRAAVDRHVALEVNGSPFRLDLTDTMARAAVEAGAVLAINSDAHSASQLELIRFGVYQARRGWVEARNVVNTWLWAKLSHWLGARRKS